MDDQNTLDRMRALFRKTNEEQEYEPIDDDIEEGDFDEVRRPILVVPDEPEEPEPFSWWIYFVFLLLGIAMLWAWLVIFLLRRYSELTFDIGTCFSPQRPTSKAGSMIISRY